MEIGIIGLPQSGKTTVLRALTRDRSEAGTPGSSKQGVHAGVTRFPDPRLDSLTEIFIPDKVVPVEIKYWDVPAGPGPAGDGTAIGGQFLNLLQGADALLHVVRAFEDPSVPHINGTVDPSRDAGEIEAELAFSDLSIVERRTTRIEAGLKGAKPQERDLLLREQALLQRIKDGLEQDLAVREHQYTREEEDVLSNYQLLTAKPLLTVFNIDEESLENAFQMDADLDDKYLRPGCKATALCAQLEMELSQLSREDEAEFLESYRLRESGLTRIARLSLELLSLVSFFTFMSKEVRAWTVSADTPAAKAAGRIHTDMERGFIRAEVVGFDDLAKCGSVAQCRKQGLLRLEGKSYPVKDGDVITFLFNV